jgi:hypothetical protein
MSAKSAPYGSALKVQPPHSKLSFIRPALSKQVRTCRTRPIASRAAPLHPPRLSVAPFPPIRRRPPSPRPILPAQRAPTSALAAPAELLSAARLRDYLLTAPRAPEMLHVPPDH